MTPGGLGGEALVPHAAQLARAAGLLRPEDSEIDPRLLEQAGRLHRDWLHAAGRSSPCTRRSTETAPCGRGAGAIGPFSSPARAGPIRPVAPLRLRA